MSKTQIIISAGAILLIIGIFLLPKVVVDNSADAEVASSGEVAPNAPSQSPEVEAVHNAQVSPEDEILLNTLRENYKSNVDNEKSAIFADSLAAVFKQYNKLDSAAKYYAIAAEKVPSQEALLKAGNTYFEAYTYAVTPERSQQLGEKAREYYEIVLGQEGGEALLDVKANLAMTYIASSDPMKGIALLREILEKDPNHKGAIFNLGVLSIQSNQYDRAIERFEQLVGLDPENVQAQFYLGLSYFEAGRKTMAKKQFEKVKTLDSDPEIQAAADGYLEEIQ